MTAYTEWDRTVDPFYGRGVGWALWRWNRNVDRIRIGGVFVDVRRSR